MQEKKTKSEARKDYWSTVSLEDRRERMKRASLARWKDVSLQAKSEHGRMMNKARNNKEIVNE